MECVRYIIYAINIKSINVFLFPFRIHCCGYLKDIGGLKLQFSVSPERNFALTERETPDLTEFLLGYRQGNCSFYLDVRKEIRSIEILYQGERILMGD